MSRWHYGTVVAWQAGVWPERIWIAVRPSVRPSAELRTKEPLSSQRPNRVHVTHPESEREEEEEEEHAKRALCTELCRSQANLA